MVAETGYQMPTSPVEHLPIVVIFSIFIGYQMAIQMAINVVVFSIFNIVTRDVPYYDQSRCVVPNIHTARELMRWLTALLCFVEAQYDTLEKGNCTRHNCIFRYIPAALLYFVEARSVIFGPAMRLFCKSPGMGDSDYKDFHYTFMIRH